MVGIELRDAAPGIRITPAAEGVAPDPRALAAGLASLGLLGVQNHEKYIPRIYRDACRSARLALIQGLLDTDGWVEKSNAVRFCTGSYRLAKDVVELVRSLGGWCSMAFQRTGCKGEKGRCAYVLRIDHAEPRTLFRLASSR